MTQFGSKGLLLRPGAEHGHQKVTFIELFFDLVFVFAITQLSHHLVHDLNWEGVVQTLILFVAVWWAWIDTAWVTNWLDPERKPVRLMLLALMLVGLILSSSIPQAFHAHALAFALSYAVIQTGRSAFTIWAVRGRDREQALNFTRILIWQTLVGTLWIVGALLEHEARLVIWALAAVIETLAAALGFYVPGLGASKAAQWKVEGGHLAERCGLFIIIALGESILVTGATFSELKWTGTSVSAFLTAFLGTVAMWWIYFDTGSERSGAHMVQSEKPGAMARLGYTYIHQIIVIGIMVCAVADALILAHPDGHASTATMAAILGGPALYLLGVGLFKFPLLNRFPLSHVVGLALLAALVPIAPHLSPLWIAMGATCALLIAAAWEVLALRRTGAAPPA